jgi:hypothetical protein
MKALLGVAFSVITFVLPLQAAVNPILFNKSQAWLQTNPNWTQTVTYARENTLSHYCHLHRRFRRDGG